MKEFKWSELPDRIQGDPVRGEIAMVSLNLKVAFTWSDKITEEYDEYNRPVSYRSGYIMEVLRQQKFVFHGEPRMTVAFSTAEKP